MNERINESLSALMDGEADELEIRRLLNQDEQQQVFDKWSKYHLIGAVLRDQPATTLDLSKGVRQALDGEPMDDVPLAPNTQVAQPNKLRWLMASGAVAASVTLAVLVGVQWQQNDPFTGKQSAQYASSMQTNPAALNVAETTMLSVEEELQLKEAQMKLQEYVLRHNDETNTGGAPVMLPHARTVNFSQGVEIKR